MGNAPADTGELGMGTPLMAVNNGCVNPNQVREAHEASEEKQAARDTAAVGDWGAAGCAGGVKRVTGASNGDKVVSKNRPTTVSTESVATACVSDPRPRVLGRGWCKRRSNRSTKSHAAVSHSAGTVDVKLCEVGAGPTLAEPAAAGVRARVKLAADGMLGTATGLGTRRNDSKTCRHCNARTKAIKAGWEASGSLWCVGAERSGVVASRFSNP
jgi:hypothetical protein